METNCPYRGLPDRAVWRQCVGRRTIETILPLDDDSAPIARGTKIASAGSCFAQRIAEHVAGLGLEHLVTEPGPSFLAPPERKQLGYGIYSARYGNVYTAEQLAQLLERAYGHFAPSEPPWRKGERHVDPFRPGINHTGFVSVDECLEDRRQHLAAVRMLIERAEVFVVTLGLTEAWRSRADGAVFPACPGCGHGGDFDPERHEFVDFRLEQVVAALDRFVTLARHHNPDLRFVLTVSPVPLLATFTRRHVLTATTAAKAVLRVACDELRRRHRGIDYFPAFELVQAGGPGWAFADDRRTVQPRAVAHIMACFAAQFGLDVAPAFGQLPSAAPATEPVTRIPPRPVVCDEDTILAAMLQERGR
ncbi:MAG: GSCFA domain-containing protein [Planctomycetes bacterium]|jgi:hypothetical protein|nr:GSCFA domain-containing protein [Planctomycetota bacterium]